ncbi:hypothetical protein [Francisella sp. 19X1-34]|uniref:hypothetical protein n=1 Tax=Francisella sp. 19X1-34 TaxID=3087177 RepID=UPI002E329FBB|nr:hypothetical protein [Francisella sp. 19X1-34]MED7787528.1 hypothetical protein [Francisella sp. 19X1-34]
MESEKKLSVVIIYNQRKYYLLKKSLKSIYSQARHDKINVFIVDTCGDLDHNDKLFSSQSLSFNLIKKVDISYYEALNSCASIVSSEWISFLQIGSTYASENVIKDILSMTKANTADIYYGDSLKIVSESLNTYKTEVAKPVETISKSQPFQFESCIFKTSILKSYMFNTTYKYSAEYDLLIRLFKDDISFVHLLLPISKSSFLKSFEERIEKLFIISKYFGEEALVNSEYYKPFARLGDCEVNRIKRHIRYINTQINEQEKTLQERQKEFGEIQNTLVYRLGKKIYSLLYVFPWRRK